MSPFAKKLLSHGFLFITGMAYFMAWNDEVAALVRFPGHEVWRPLSFAWAILLLYDATRRSQYQRYVTQDDQSGETGELLLPSKIDWRGISTTLLRFLFFFTVLGAIGLRQIAAYVAVAVIAIAVFMLERKRPRTSLSDSQGGHR